jgi:uncharacterized protein involved in exopolysaccharide biosynthesis
MTEDYMHTPMARKAVELSLRDFALPLFRRKRVLIWTFIAVLLGIPLIALFLGPAYSSRMVILVNRERLDPLVSTEATTQLINSDNPVTPEEINSEVELLHSRDVLEQVVVTNGLEKSQGFSLVDLLRPHQTREDRIARAVKGLAKQIKVANIRNSNLIEITYQTPNPELSYRVLKSLGDLYVAKHVAVHRPTGSYEFFAQQTENYRKELEDAERRLREFGRTNAIAAPDDQRTNLASQASDSFGLLHAAEQSIAADKERIASDRQQLLATPSRSTTLQTSAANDKLIDDLNAALLAAQTKRTQLLLKYDPSFPLVKEADQEVRDDQAAVAKAEEKKYTAETSDRDPTYELLREDLAKSQVDLSGQHATLDATKRSIQSIRSEMVRLDQLAITQQDLEREVKAAESNYLLYLAKREQERTSNALDVTRIANVAIAVPPTIPALPVSSWPMIILVGLGSAIVLSIGLAYAIDYFDPSFHTPEQVMEDLGVPFVVAIPRRRA